MVNIRPLVAVRHTYLAPFLHRLYSFLLVIVLLCETQQQSLASSLQFLWGSRLDKPIEPIVSEGTCQGLGFVLHLGPLT